ATRHRSSCSCRLLLTVGLDGGVEGVAGDEVLGGVVAKVRAVVPVLVDGGEDLAHPAHGGVLVLAVAACLGDELGGPCRIDVPVALAVGEGKGDVAQELLGAVLARRLPLLVGELLGPVAVVDERRPVGVPAARRAGQVTTSQCHIDVPGAAMRRCRYKPSSCRTVSWCCAVWSTNPFHVRAYGLLRLVAIAVSSSCAGTSDVARAVGGRSLPRDSTGVRTQQPRRDPQCRSTLGPVGASIAIRVARCGSSTLRFLGAAVSPILLCFESLH